MLGVIRSLLFGSKHGATDPRLASQRCQRQIFYWNVAHLESRCMLAVGEIGESPVSVTAGDFNGDGLLDLATANQVSNDVSVLLGDGDGNFVELMDDQGTPIRSPVGSEPRSVTTGDFDGNGTLDLAVANFTRARIFGNVSVLLGNGDGTFGEQTFVGVGGRGPISVITGQFNDDNRDGVIDDADNLDLAVANRSSHEVSLLQGLGDGRFTETQVIRVGADGIQSSGPHSFASGQFNDDNDDGVVDERDIPDLATANNDSHNVSILLGDGNGGFTEQQRVKVGTGESRPASVTTGDFDGDGHLDLATANSDSDEVSVLRGNGDGTFTERQILRVGIAPVSVTTADLDGDGQLDLAASNQSDDDVSLLIGRGDGTFAEQIRIPAGDGPRFVIADDFDRDGRMDLVTANRFSNDVSVLLNSPTILSAVAASKRFSIFAGRLAAVTVSQFNDDNQDGVIDENDFLDLATANEASGDVSLFLGRGNGNFVDQTRWNVGEQPVALATGDFNFDGRLDLVAANNGSDDLSVLLGMNDGMFASQRLLKVGDRPAALTKGDFNGDGRLDIAAANFASDDVSVLLGNSAATFGKETRFPVGRGPKSLTIGQINDDNGDGISDEQDFPDLVTANSSSNDISILLGDGLGNFIRRIPPLPVGTMPSSVMATDFDGDGHVDLIVANEISNDVSVLTGHGDGTFSVQIRAEVGLGPRAVTMAQFTDDNFDGVIDENDFLDLITANSGSGDASLRLGDGKGSFFPQHQRFPAGDGPVSLAHGDFDRDGRPDLVISNQESDDVSVLLGKEQFADVVNTRVKIRPSMVASGDLNGDRRVDLVTPSFTTQGGVSILINEPDGSFTRTDQLFEVGRAPRSLALGDFDRDGRLDLAAAPDAGIRVLQGNGDGTFSDDFVTLVAVDEDGQPLDDRGQRSLTTADMNNDGLLDLVAIVRLPRYVSVYLGRGDLTFDPQPSVKIEFVEEGRGPLSVATGQFNDDNQDGTINDEDFVDVVTATDSAERLLAILLGNGDGTLGTPVEKKVANFANSVTTGQFNDDNQDGLVNDSDLLDLVATNRFGNKVSLFKGNGDGTFTENGFGGLTLPVGEEPSSVTSGDLNGDGLPDLVAANRDSSDHSLLIGRGDGTFFDQVRFRAGQSGSGPERVLVVDVDGDGSLDVVAANTQAHEVAVLFNSVFIPTNQIPVGRGPASVTNGDFNDDGNLDVAVVDEFSNEVALRLGSGDGNFDEHEGSWIVGDRPESLTAGDFNRDGRLDLVTANSGSDDVSVLLSKIFADEIRLATDISKIDVAAKPAFVTTGHFNDDNGDGKLDQRDILDLVTANSGTNTVSVLLQGNSDRRIPVGNGPGSITVGDLNNDDHLDLVTANFHSDDLSVLLGNGDGNYETLTAVSVGDGPMSVTMGDFNGDGHNDLASANSISNDVSVLVGGGDGTFAAQARITVGREPQSVMAGDFNGDGHIDMATANSESNDVSLLLGRGDGTFEAQMQFPVGNKPRSLVLGHFNDDDGDGKIDQRDNLDLVTANHASDDLSLLLGNGDGTFTKPPPEDGPVAAGDGPISVTAGHFNRRVDDNLDLAVLRFSDMLLLRGDGRGGFHTPVSFDVGDDARSLAAGDFNGDGLDDLAVARFSDVLLLLGNDDGMFPKRLRYEVGDDARAIAFADFNEDGHPDLATANFSSQDVSLVLNTPAIPVGERPSSVAVGDFNRDGQSDLATANSDTDNISVLTGRGDGFFVEEIQYAAGDEPSSLTTGQFNDDNQDGTVNESDYLDLAIANSGSDEVSVLFGRGDGTFEEQVRFAVGSNPLSIVAVDFNHNGHLDLATANSQSHDVSLLLGQEDGTFARDSRLNINGREPRAVTAGDFDEDGNLDLTTVNFQSEDISLLVGNGDGSFDALTPIAIGEKPVSVTTGDFDSDGHLDLTVAHFAATLLLLGNGTGEFVGVGRFDVGEDARSLTSGDFTGNGRVDLATSNFASNDVSLLINTPAIFFPERRFSVGNTPVSVAASHFNEDNVLDLATANFSSDNVSVLLGQGDGTFVEITDAEGQPIRPLVGTSPSSVTATDFDGDGLADLATSNFTSKNVSFLRGRGDGTFEPSFRNDNGESVFPVGEGPVSITTGDIDFDGNMDVATANSLSDNVTILMGSGNGNFLSKGHLEIGAVPSAVGIGDFNGDNRLDLVTANFKSSDVTRLFGRGGGDFFAQQRTPVGLRPRALTVGDFDDDGRDDVITIGLVGDVSLVPSFPIIAEVAIARTEKPLFATLDATGGVSLTDESSSTIPESIAFTGSGASAAGSGIAPSESETTQVRLVSIRPPDMPAVQLTSVSLEVQEIEPGPLFQAEPPPKDQIDVDLTDPKPTDGIGSNHKPSAEGNRPIDSTELVAPSPINADGSTSHLRWVSGVLGAFFVASSFCWWILRRKWRGRDVGD